MGNLQQRDARRVEFVGKRGITGRRKYADLLYCIPQRNRCRGCEITDSGGILRGVRKNLGAIVFDFSDGSGMGNIMQKGGPSGNLRISGRRLCLLYTSQGDGTIEGAIAYQIQALELDAENYALENVQSFYLTIDDVLEEQSQDE